MSRARKVCERLRDPLCALHAQTIDVEMKDGDAKVSGRALAVTDLAVKASFLGSHDNPEAVADAAVFQFDVTEATLVRVKTDLLHIDTWTATKGLAPVERT